MGNNPYLPKQKSQPPRHGTFHCGGHFPKHKPHYWSKGDANDVGTMVICPGGNRGHRA